MLDNALLLAVPAGVVALPVASVGSVAPADSAQAGPGPEDTEPVYCGAGKRREGNTSKCGERNHNRGPMRPSLD